MATASYHTTYTTYPTADCGMSGDTVTSGVIWTGWVQGPFVLNGTTDYGTDAVTVGIGSEEATTWRTWTAGVAGAPVIVPETPEARQAREAQQAVWLAQQAKQAEEAKAAAERAERLLVEHLAPAQRAAYEKDRFFEVVAAKARYRIYHDGAVRRLGEDGREVATYCIHPDEAIPAGDLALAKKLLLESDEATFRRIANESLVGNAQRA